MPLVPMLPGPFPPRWFGEDEPVVVVPLTWTNEVSNPSVEVDATGSTASVGVATLISTDSFVGANCMEQVVTVAASGAQEWGLYTVGNTRKIAVTPGRLIYAAVAMQMVSTDVATMDMRCYVRWYNGAGVALQVAGPGGTNSSIPAWTQRTGQVATTGLWAALSGVMVVPDLAKFVSVYAYAQPNGGTATWTTRSDAALLVKDPFTLTPQFTDDFSVDQFSTSGPWTNLSNQFQVSGGHLVLTHDAGTKLMQRNVAGFSVVDSDVTMKVTTGAAAPLSTDSVRAAGKLLSNGNYACANLNGTSLRAQTLVGAALVMNTSRTVQLVANTTYWVRCIVKGDNVVAALYEADPATGAGPTELVGDNMKGTDRDTFGAGIATSVGIIAINTTASDWTIDDYVCRSVDGPEPIYFDGSNAGTWNGTAHDSTSYMLVPEPIALDPAVAVASGTLALTPPTQIATDAAAATAAGTLDLTIPSTPVSLPLDAAAAVASGTLTLRLRVLLRPNIDVLTGWQTDAASHNAALDDAVEQPAAPSITSDEVYTFTATATDRVGFGDAPGMTGTADGNLWVYARGGSARGATIELYKGATLVGSATVNAGDAPGWLSVPFSGLTEAEVDSLEMRLVAT